MTIFSAFFDKVIAHNHMLFMDESDVTSALSVVNSSISIYRREVIVERCGWADSPKTWSLYFKATNKEWSRIIRVLNVTRIWSVREIPEYIMNNVVYSVD